MDTLPQPFKPEKKPFIKPIVTAVRGRFKALPGVTRKILPGALFYFILSIAQCFFVPSPYSICCLSASMFVGLKPDGALLGMFAGICLRLLWGIDMDAAQYLTYALCYLVLHLFPIKKQSTLIVFTFFLLLLRSLPGLIAANDMQTRILCAACVLTGLAAMPALIRAAQMVKEKRLEGTEDDLLCLLLPVLLMLTGASRITVFSLNLGFLFASFLTVLASCAAGAAAGVCLSLGCGIALMMGGQNAVQLLWLAFASLAAGILQGKNGCLIVMAFLAAGCAIQYLSTFSLDMSLPLAALMGCVCFLLLHGRPKKKAIRLIRKLCWRQPRENLYTRFRMQKWAKAIERMSGALPDSRIEAHDAEEESEAITEELCATCEQMTICWRDRFEQTKAGVYALTQRMADGENGYLGIINQHFSACPRISRLPAILEALDKARLERVRRSVYADYQKEMLRTHLAALSDAAKKISMEGGLLNEEESDWMTRAEDALQSMRFPGHAAFVKKIDGRMTVCIQYDPLSLRPNTADLLCRQLSAYLNVRLQLTEQRGGRVLMEEEPPLKVISGMATACAVTRERKLRLGKQGDNGDDVLVERLSGGKMLLALSDGMGHGTGAQDESHKTLELLSLCMEAGYSRNQAVKAVNGVMLSATGGEKFATVDICMIDLWNGHAAVNKLGACASFLFQGRKLHRLEGHALPLGIIEHVLPTESEVTLGEGDLLLMMSDGITDAFEGEEDILSVFRRVSGDTPQHIADAILQEAIVQQGGLPQDDMTVLCAQVVSARAEKQRRFDRISA